MSGAGDGWDEAVAAWAGSRPDIRALVQIGSRVQAGAFVDRWSDYDYHLVTSDPGRYRDGSFCSELGPCWAQGAQVAFGSAVKVTAVLPGALEADFVILSHWEVRVAAMALAFSGTAPLWPAPLARGVANLRIVAAPGWKVIKGGAAWERRYSRIAPLRLPLTQAEFGGLCGEFWTQLVWAAKKAERGELRASQRALHVHLIENSLRMLQEEALLAGRAARPLGRRAEAWMTPEQLEGTDFSTALDRDALLSGMERIMDVFEKASLAVGQGNGWDVPRHAEVRAWMNALRVS
jgi:Streptomycin adenylyltransferase